MKEIALSVPDFGKIDQGLPSGVPTGGLTAGLNAIWVFLVLIITISVLISFWFLIKGGLDIIMSRGQKEKLKSGRERVIYAVLGLAFIFISFAMLGLISSFFGVPFLPFNFNK